MPQKDFSFNPVSAGDPITDKAWNDIGMQVMRLTGVPGVGSISTGAGVFTRTIPTTSTVVSYFSLNAPLYRTKNAEADKLRWDGSDWTDDGGDDVTLYGNFSTGYWFSGDIVQAIKSNDADRWYVIGCGHTLVRGVLDSAIDASGDKVNVSVYEWSSPSWGDSGTVIRVRESLGIASPLASTTNVYAGWHEQAQQWVFTGAACESMPSYTRLYTWNFGCPCCRTSGILYCGSGNNRVQILDTGLNSATSTSIISGNSQQKMDFDSNGNVYVADGNEFYKFGPGLGTPTWNVSLGSDGTVIGIAVDSTNSWIYCSGNDIGTTKFVRKFDLDGNEITTGGWPYDLGTSTAGGGADSTCCALDSNLDLWVGHYPTTGTGNPSLTVLDSTGSKVADYQPFPIGGSHYQWPRQLAIDSSDNVYCALSSLGFSNATENLVKINSSGVKQWGKSPDSSSGNGYFVALNDSEDLVAVVGGQTTGDDVYVYNDSGTLQWSDRQAYGVLNSCVYDANNNLFVATGDNSAPRDSVVKYDSSGNQTAEIDLGGLGQSLARKK